jgi:hypothetical protein
VALTVPVALAGCVRSVGPVQLAPAPSSPPPAEWPDDALSPLGPPPSARPSTAPAVTRSFAEATAAPCAGRPSGDQVVSVLRRVGLLTAGVYATVRTGPLCSGSWQYTVIAVVGREPLQVVTKGTPGSLSLVTAGTDVCTVDVRAAAPAGIRSLTSC